MFKVGDLVKTYRIVGTSGYIGVITQINENQIFSHTVRWINVEKSSQLFDPVFKAEQLRKVS